jgi:hypothetical protein
LNGGFEDWTGGKPDDWNGVLVAPEVTYSADTLCKGGKLSLLISFGYIYPIAGPEGLVLTNATSKHPKGFAITRNASFLSFWYGWSLGFGPVELQLKTNTGINILLPKTYPWSKVFIPINKSFDSIVIQFNMYAQSDSKNSWMGFFYLDEVMFDSVPSSILNFSSVEIFPSPISSHANLKYHLDGSASIHSSIFDLTGREVMQLPSVPSASGDGAIPFDCDGLPNGLYYLRFEAGGTVTMRKIIVQH